MNDTELLQIIEKATIEEVTSLDLSGMGLTALPPEIGELSNLEPLLREVEHLTEEIVSEIGQLINPTELSLENNQPIMPIEENQSLLASQNYTTVRGTRISLIKPKGFTEAENFSGFQQPDTGATIIVTEMPAPYSEIASGFNTEKLKARGMTLLATQNIAIDGYNGQLLQVTQVVYFTTFAKWLAVFGDETETVMLAASLPQEMENTLSKPLIDSLLGAKWQKDKVLDPFADLNFAITTTPELKFTQRLQNMLLYTNSGVIPAKSPEEPLFIVGASLYYIELIDQKQEAEKRIAQTEQVKNLSIDTSNEINIDGLSGYEIVATALDVETNTPLVVYQVMLFEEKTYDLMQGLVGSLKTEYLEDFQKMARSFRIKHNV